MQTFKKGDANFRYFAEGCESNENLDLGAKSRGLNSFSSEKLPKCRIIYPKGGICTIPLAYVLLAMKLQLK